MRTIPKKTDQKNTVWRSYSLRDILVALALFSVAFALFCFDLYAAAVCVCLLTVVLLIPTGEGAVYEISLSALKFLFAKKDYRRGKAGADTKDLYPLKCVDETGCAHFSGGKEARFLEIGQKNFALETKAEQDRDIEIFAQALKEIPIGFEADLVSVRRPINLDKQCSMLSSKIDGESAGARVDILRGEADECEAVNCVNKKYLPYFCLVIYGGDRESLDAVAASVAAKISATLPVKILERGDVAIFLKYSLSHECDEKKMRKYPKGKIATNLLPESVRFRASSFCQDGEVGVAAAVTDFPLKVKNAWGARLFALENGMTSMRISPIERDKAIKQIDKSVREMSAKRTTSEKASEQASAETHLDSMKELLEALQNDNETLFDTAVTFVSFFEDAKKSLKSFARRQDFKLSLLYGRQLQGFKSACVSPDFYLKGFSRGINSTTLAAAFPFVRSCVSDETGTSVGTAGGAPFILDIWKRGGEYQNSNAMIMGKSGSGKSYFLKSFLCSEWAKGTRVFVLDPENEYAKIAKKLGGETLDVASPAEGRINPFHIYASLTEDGSAAPFEVSFNAHLKTLESFYKIVLEGASAEVLELVNSLTVETYRRCGFDETKWPENLSAEDFPTFSDLFDTLTARRAEAAEESEKKELRCASLYLEKFVTGRYKDIWNGPSTMTAGADMAVFEFQSLFGNKNTVVANAQMLLLFGFLEQEIINERNLGEARRTIVAVDEAHLFIDEKYPIALDFFHSMCKRIRKYDGAFIAATQSPADWNANEELRFKTSAILKNSQYTFVFKLSPPDMKDLDDLFSAGGGFNDEEKRRMVTAKTGQMFFVGSSATRFCANVKSAAAIREIIK